MMSAMVMHLPGGTLVLIWACLIATGSTQTTPAPGAEFISDEQKVYDKLMKNYNKHLRPVRNASETVTVSFGIALLELIELDEVSEHLDILVWKRMAWKDFRLSWNPSEYGGISQIRLPGDQIWQADIVSFLQSGTDRFDNVLAVVSSGGDVLYIPPGQTRLKCSVDLTYFPADTQTCIGKFGSWTYDGFKIKLQMYDGLEQLDTSDYIQDNEFLLVKLPAKVKSKWYPCCEEPYEHVSVNVTLRRFASRMYFSLLLTPGVMIALLAPFLFILPSGDPHRFNMGGALLVALTILMMILSKAVPPHPSPPLISQYFSGLFVVVSLSLALSTLTTNLAHRRTRLAAMPQCLKMMMACLARPLFVDLDTAVYDKMEDLRPSEDEASARVAVQKTQGDWRVLATVLDRLFCLLFLLITIIMSCAILPQIVNYH